MRIEQATWTSDRGWTPDEPHQLGESAQLVFLFAAHSLLSRTPLLDQISQKYPKAHLMGCSTAGEIAGTRVLDDTLVLTAIHFEHTKIQVGYADIAGVEDGYRQGLTLARALEPEGLVHALVFSDGLLINGSHLARGLSDGLPAGTPVTGGMAGDGINFQETLVLRQGTPTRGALAIIGFYGERIRVGCAGLGGWDPFGPERLVTKSKGGVLYELDGRSALELYKKYLGDYAAELPSSAQLFPLNLRGKEGEPSFVRTILAFNEEEQSITFAGDVPEGTYARLMKANFNRLVDGACSAAKASTQTLSGSSPELAVLISCVGRKMVLGQRIEEEVEGARDVLGEQAVLTGFYSYGEISPYTPGAECAFQNQTIVITAFSEE